MSGKAGMQAAKGDTIKKNMERNAARLTRSLAMTKKTKAILLKCLLTYQCAQSKNVGEQWPV